MAHTNTREQQQHQSLYLEVNSSDEDTAYPELPLHTSISLFLLSYCECKCFKVHLVSAKPAASSLSLIGRIPSSLDICDIQPGNVPALVRGCRLPAVLDETGMYCRAGLAVVLRHIINRTIEIDPSRKDVLALLGFKKTCLKACAEVSHWTRLCELGIPSAVEEHLQNPADPSLHLPSSILDLEKRLGEPVKVHNDDKIRRQKLQQQKQQQQKKKASQSSEAQENPDSDSQSAQRSEGGLELMTALAKLSVDAVPPPATRESSEIRRVRTTELPPLEHVFAEGLYFTLTDVVLLPCIYQYLCSLQMLSPGTLSGLPLLLRWYSRVQEVPGVLTAAAACGMLLPMDPHAPQTPGPPSPSSPPAPEAVTGVMLTDLVVQDGMEGGTTTTAVPQAHFVGGPRPTMTKLKDHGIEAMFSPHPNPDWTLAWNDLPAAVNPTEGKMSDVRAIRKRQQLNNLVAMVMELARTGQTVVDFCSGGGHVGIVLAHTLPDCQVILIENKEESLVRAKSRSAELGLTNIGFIQANLDYFTGPFDIGVALHACGVATDMVVGHCIQAGASFVVSPCCYGFIQNTVKFSFPRSKRFQESLSYKEHMILCRFADQTAVQLPPERRLIGKQCMGLVDLDRSWAAEAYGYSVQVMTMVPESCSPKNSMLVGRARENAPVRESTGMYR